MQTLLVRQDKSTVKNGSFFKRWFYRNHRWLYRGQRPSWYTKIVNRAWAIVAARSTLFNGLLLKGLVTLEIVGRKSGRIISFPLVMVTLDGQRYLASMLGNEAQWVRNLQAASGQAVLRTGGSREEVQLEEVPAEQRASILKVYLHAAPGARPHVPIDKDAPLEEFEKIAAAFPVFHLVSRPTK